MVDDIRDKLKEQLIIKKSISYKEICEILDAFQIASGQGFAIGKTKALLDFLKEGKSFVIENFEYTDKGTEVTSINQLVNIFNDIDKLIDLSKDKDFIEYFS